MSLSITPSNDNQPIHILSLMSEADNVASDIQKDSKIDRSLHHEKNKTLVNKSIDKMEEQQEQNKKASFFQFVIGMVSNLLNMVTQAIDFALPGAGSAIAKIINEGLQGSLQQLSQLNPYGQNAEESALDSEKFKKLAEEESYHFSMEDERVKNARDSQQKTNDRMEKALLEMQGAKESILKQ